MRTHLPSPPAASPACPAQAVRSAAQALGAILRLAQALAERGEGLDLAGLDQQVGRVCASALDLPLAEGRELRADLFALRQQVDLLAQALRGAS
jgi:hypothetical protein